jgi:prepilin-type N-terminal cleavage/methylation domain-containing protein
LYKYAFTLIELLIVVAIIGILAAIAVPNFLNAQVRAKVAKVSAEQKSVKDAYLMYKLDNNGWPKHIDGDLAQHKFITTPIAYLSTSLSDPFFNSKTGQNTPEWGWFKGQYHMEPAYFWHTGQWPGLSKNDPTFWSQQSNTAFFIISIGPDQVFEMQTASANLYNVSNGTSSKGDIIHAVPGSFKSTYPYVNGDWLIQ